MTYGCGCDVWDNCSCSPCDRGECYHDWHCDACGRGFEGDAPASSICLVCESEWLAARQLQDRQREPVGIAAVLEDFKRRYAPALL